ncbi:MAG TPA: SDR family oxidoreductase, partial [Burkholderiaceae bacterium]|nr:SDR family oxidoreductase [Burkholderiaceae bacterium]
MVVPLNVFITGASSGIGEALAREYAQRGAMLGLVARRREPIEALITETHAYGRAYALDVTKHGALRAAAQIHLRDYGCPDIVIANAGVSAGTVTEAEEDLDVFARILNTNVLAVVATFQPFIDAMRARGRGTLVVIASVAGIRGLPGAGAYSASKAAVMTYAESLRAELRGSGIRVVTIAPGYIDTPMTRGNPYRMPFLMPVDKFARRAAQTIDQGDAFRIIPWPMSVVAWLLRHVPRGIYDRLASRAPRKPRVTPSPPSDAATATA